MAPTATVENGLETRTEESSELAPVAAGVGIEAEIKAAITVALRFPRNEDRAFEKLMRACNRTSFADDASYSFPRGDSDVSGPSIYLAREAARVWGNMRHGCDIIADDDENRTIEAWAWDLETNTKITSQDSFKKLIFRKRGGWVKPDERDLRELTNRRAALAKRNCILEILPKDLIEDALRQADVTLKDKASKDPDGERKKILIAFSALNISATMLEQYLTHPVGQSSPAELAQLRKIYKSIADGNSKWTDYVATPEAPKEPARASQTNGSAPTAVAMGADRVGEQARSREMPSDTAGTVGGPLPSPVSGDSAPRGSEQPPADNPRTAPPTVGVSHPPATGVPPKTPSQPKTSTVVGLVEDTRYIDNKGLKYFEVVIKSGHMTQVYAVSDERLYELVTSFEGTGTQVKGEWQDATIGKTVVKLLTSIAIQDPELSVGDIFGAGK